MAGAVNRVPDAEDPEFGEHAGDQNCADEGGKDNPESKADDMLVRLSQEIRGPKR